ncbi:MAG: hypothetical protein P1U90_15515 [Akkermansiaceae bacterium]|nr:hypothetical protein [Akkermansiaceae bacterium]
MKQSHDLIWKLIDRSMTTAEFEALQNELLKDPDLRRFYQDCLETEFTLREFRLSAPVLKSPRRKSGLSSPVVRRSLVIVMGMAACLMAFVIWNGNPDTPASNKGSIPIAQTLEKNYRFTPWVSGNSDAMTSNLASEIRERALWAASITGIGDETGTKLALPHPLPGGILEVTEGWVEVSFDQSAVVRIEAPSTFEILSSSSGYLYRGNISVTDDGPGANFTIFHDQGKVVDIGTAFAMRVGEGDDYDIFVREGIVDNYNGVVLTLDRLREGDHFAGGKARKAQIQKPATPPFWVVQEARRVSLRQGVPVLEGERYPVETTTWLRGAHGGGEASGNLSGVGIKVTSDACHNSGEVHPMRWADHLNRIEPARVWYHPECASIGAFMKSGATPNRRAVLVEFQGEVQDPVLFFGWGEALLKVDLDQNEVMDGTFCRAHDSITFKDHIVDFGTEAHRQNIESQAASIQLKGKFGPGEPLKFYLLSSNELPSTLSFSLGLVVRE